MHNTTSVPTQAPLSMTEFYTKDAANEGAELKLTRPDGTPTGAWLRVVSSDSDKYAEVSAIIRKKALKNDALTDDESRMISASCVLDWSLAEPCTPENVATLFKNARSLQQQVELLIYDTKHFFAARA